MSPTRILLLAMLAVTAVAASPGLPVIRLFTAGVPLLVAPSVALVWRRADSTRRGPGRP